MQCRVTVRGTADGGSVGFGPDLSCTDVVLYTFMLSCFQNRVVARVTPESCLTEIRFSWAAPNSLRGAFLGSGMLLRAVSLPRWKRRSLPGSCGPEPRGGHGAERRRERSRVLCRQHPGQSGRPPVHRILHSQGSRLWGEGKASPRTGATSPLSVGTCIPGFVREIPSN